MGRHLCLPPSQPPVDFTATLLDWGGGLSGSCEERAADERGRVGVRRAAFAGLRSGAAVALTKSYDGGSGWGHVVAYRGVLSADGCLIEGRWSIPGVWDGPFVMRRERRAEEARARAGAVEA